MKATRLVGTFRTKRTGVADVAAIEKPDATERDAFVDQPLNEALKDRVERSLLGKGERHLLQRVRVHAWHITRYFVDIQR